MSTALPPARRRRAGACRCRPMPRWRGSCCCAPSTAPRGCTRRCWRAASTATLQFDGTLQLAARRHALRRPVVRLLRAGARDRPAAGPGPADHRSAGAERAGHRAARAGTRLCRRHAGAARCRPAHRGRRSGGHRRCQRRGQVDAAAAPQRPAAAEPAAACRVEGIALARASLAEVRRRVGYVFQDADDQLFMPTVQDDVAFGPMNQGLRADRGARARAGRAGRRWMRPTWRRARTLSPVGRREARRGDCRRAGDGAVDPGAGRTFVGARPGRAAPPDRAAALASRRRA